MSEVSVARGLGKKERLSIAAFLVGIIVKVSVSARVGVKVCLLVPPLTYLAIL